MSNLRRIGGAFFLCILVSACSSTQTAATQEDIQQGTQMKKKFKSGPRKVIIGTTILPVWGTSHNLDKRLAELAKVVDTMATEAKSKYRRGLDIAVLPECIITSGLKDAGASEGLPLEGKILDFMSTLAKKHKSYVTIPMNRVQIRKAQKIYTNIVGLVDRQGELVGVYEKVHLVSCLRGPKLEDGKTCGKSFPVFDCDFGRVGFQICYDIVYDDGWEQLKKNGAEIVLWPTMSPQTARPSAYALKHDYYVVSSTPRNNASIFEPTGMAVYQTKRSGSVVVGEIDLDYELVPWSIPLENGNAFDRSFGKRSGYNYYPAEDMGIFWSNDPNLPISHMLKQLKILNRDDDVARNLKIQRASRK